jgi:hypothetical protein
MPLRIDVMADDDFRKQLLEIMRQQMEPLVVEAMKSMLSKEDLITIFKAHIQEQFQAGDVGRFRDEIKKEIVANGAYGESYRMLPDEARREGRKLVKEMMERWIQDSAKDQLQGLIREAFKRVVIA